MTPEELDEAARRLSSGPAIMALEEGENRLAALKAEIRLEALEEAAKIARAWIDNQTDVVLGNDPLGRGEGAALEIESAIRERAKQ